MVDEQAEGGRGAKGAQASSSPGGRLRAVLEPVAAGAIGTAAMTATIRLERRALGTHEPVDYDDSPILVEQLEAWTPLSIPGRDEHAVNLGARFVYGSVAGWLRAGLDGRTRRPATAFFAVMWIGEVLGLKALGLAPWPWRWRRRWLVSSLAQHAVYAVATDVAHRALRGDGAGRPTGSTDERPDGSTDDRPPRAAA